MPDSPPSQPSDARSASSSEAQRLPESSVAAQAVPTPEGPRQVAPAQATFTKAPQHITQRRILRVALPTLLMNTSTPLLAAVDAAVAGHLTQVAALGGVGIGGLIFTMVYWVFGFLRMSTVGLAAQNYGRGNHAKNMDLLVRAQMLAFCGGVLVILLREPLLSAALWFTAPSPEVAEFTRMYYWIRVWSTPAAFALAVCQGWFYGVGRVWLPVIVMVWINVLNMLLDLLFVLEFGWGVEGLAWATLAAQYSGVLLAAAWFALRFRSDWERFSMRRSMAWVPMRALLSLNRDIFLRTLLLQMTQMYFIAQSAAFGNVVLAANTILAQLRMLSAYALDGFATAAEVLVGESLGRRDVETLRKVIRYSLCWGFGMGALIGGVYIALFPWWPAWFSAHADVRAAVQRYALWAFAEPLWSNFCFILDGIFIGATAAQTMRNTMAIAVFFGFLPAMWILVPLWGNDGLWAAMAIGYLARGLTLLPALQRLPQRAL